MDTIFQATAPHVIKINDILPELDPDGILNIKIETEECGEMVLYNYISKLLDENVNLANVRLLGENEKDVIHLDARQKIAKEEFDKMTALQKKIFRNIDPSISDDCNKNTGGLILNFGKHDTGNELENNGYLKMVNSLCKYFEHLVQNLKRYPHTTLGDYSKYLEILGVREMVEHVNIEVKNLMKSYFELLLSGKYSTREAENEERKIKSHFRTDLLELRDEISEEMDELRQLEEERIQSKQAKIELTLNNAASNTSGKSTIQKELAIERRLDYIEESIFIKKKQYYKIIRNHFYKLAYYILFIRSEINLLSKKDSLNYSASNDIYSTTTYRGKNVIIYLKRLEKSLLDTANKESPYNLTHFINKISPTFGSVDEITKLINYIYRHRDMLGETLAQVLTLSIDTTVEATSKRTASSFGIWIPAVVNVEKERKFGAIPYHSNKVVSTLILYDLLSGRIIPCLDRQQSTLPEAQTDANISKDSSIFDAKIDRIRAPKNFAQELRKCQPIFKKLSATLHTSLKDFRGVIIYGVNTNDDGLFQYFQLHPELFYKQIDGIRLTLTENIDLTNEQLVKRALFQFIRYYCRVTPSDRIFKIGNKDFDMAIPYGESMKKTSFFSSKHSTSSIKSLNVENIPDGAITSKDAWIKVLNKWALNSKDENGFAIFPGGAKTGADNLTTENTKDILKWPVRYYTESLVETRKIKLDKMNEIKVDEMPSVKDLDMITHYSNIEDKFRGRTADVIMYFIVEEYKNYVQTDFDMSNILKGGGNNIYMLNKERKIYNQLLLNFYNKIMNEYELNENRYNKFIYSVDSKYQKKLKFKEKASIKQVKTKIKKKNQEKNKKKTKSKSKSKSK